ncbi:MAG TPA: RNA polymerase sigma-70 factor [Flavihumibacter sp.]
MGVEHILDDELLEQLRNDKEEALTVLYNRYWDQLFRKAFALLKDQQACEDIIQEIFLRIWNNRKNLKVKVSLGAYLAASVRYEVIRKIKAGKIHSHAFAAIEKHYEEAACQPALEQKELLDHINLIVNQLSAKCKQVYKLSREEQLSHKEIAVLLQISPKTVENHLTKALRELRFSLGFT